jgi:hypothetical protein
VLPVHRLRLHIHPSKGVAVDPVVPTKEPEEPTAVTPSEIIFHRRVRVSEHAAKTSVSETHRVFGVSRSFRRAMVAPMSRTHHRRHVVAHVDARGVSVTRFSRASRWDPPRGLAALVTRAAHRWTLAMSPRTDGSWVNRYASGGGRRISFGFDRRGATLAPAPELADSRPRRRWHPGGGICSPASWVVA